MGKHAKLKPVLYITDSVGFGGAERYLEDVVTYFKDLTKVKLLLVGSGCPELEERMAAMSVEVIRVSTGRQATWKLYKIMFAHRSWLMHVNLTYYDACRLVMLLAWLLPSAAIMCTMHSFTPKLSDGIKQRFKERLFNRYDLVIAPSQYISQTLTSIRRVHSHRIKVIYNGVVGIQSGVPTSRSNIFTVLCLGRLDIDKGYQYLFEGLNLLEVDQSWRCLVVGDGPYKNELVKRVAKMKLVSKVEFVGFQKDIISFIRASDVLVLPSLNENFPLTILEAMSAGKPVIATKVGGIPEQVEDGETGILVEPASSQKLASALEDLIKNPRLALEMGMLGKKRYREEFTLGKMLKQVELVYRSIGQ